MDEFITKIGELSKKQLMLLAAKQQQQLTILRAKASTQGQLCYQLEWQSADDFPAVQAATKVEYWLCYVDKADQCVGLQEQWVEKGIKLLLVLPGTTIVDAWTDYEITGVLYARAMENRITDDTTPTELSRYMQSTCGDLLWLIQQLGRKNLTHGLRICLLTVNAEYLAPQANINLLQGSLRGLTTVIASEYPELVVQQIDFDSADLGLNAALLLQEIRKIKQGCRIAYRQNQRYYAKLVPVLLPPRKKLKMDEGSYLITGGLGSLGLHIASYLLQQGAHTLILTSRHAELTEPVKQLQLEARQYGATIHIIKNDIADYHQAKTLMNQIASNYPVLKGIVHAAGVLADGVLAQQTESQFEAVFAPKVYGAWNLHLLSTSLSLDFFVLFSSVASQLGSVGQSNYAAANAFLDNLAAYRQCQGLVGLSINWGPWAEGGMAATKQFTRHGMQHLSAEMACQQFGLMLNTRLPQVAIFHLNRDIAEQSILKGPGLSILSVDRQIPSSNESWRTQLAQAANPEQFLQHFLLQQISIVLGLQSNAKIDPERVLMELGLDSLLAVELRNRLASTTKLKLPAGFLFDNPTCGQLLAFFKKNLLNQAEEIVVTKPVRLSAQPEPIAIIGMSCRFPGDVNDPEAYWQLLKNGLSAIMPLTDERWPMADFYDPDPEALGKMYSRYAGLISNIDGFDADFFGISPREANSMDPQQRILLELAWHALEHAGLDPLELKGLHGGVFIGPGPNDYSKLTIDPKQIDAHIGTGNAVSVCAGRLSYQLGWNGPSMVVDTACSSSLVAVHLACRSLRYGECGIALAGGINLMLTPDANIVLSRSQMLARDGLCKTFDSHADGYVRSEGAGLVVLKRLSDAIAAKDKVLAVIRGTAINQDGRSQGLTAPNGLAQEQVMKLALEEAGVTADEIQVIEAHGTGTALGDPIEMQALYHIYGQRRSEQQPLTIASVKTNIGHTESAAGIAGLIKLVLSLQHQHIPAHLHLNELNPLLGLTDEFERHAISIPRVLKPWQTIADKPRMAVLSSFGFSGTNAHLVLQEALLPTKEESSDYRNEYLFTLSAKTPAALQELANAYHQFLDFLPEHQLAAMCYTANRGRHHFAYRCAWVVNNIQQLQDHLTHLSLQEIINRADNAVTQFALLEEKSLNAFAQFYKQGGTINWDDCYPNEVLQKINLPTYPFQRQRYWLPIQVGHHIEHGVKLGECDPVLGQHLPLPFSDEQRFCTLFNERIPAYLVDHKVFNKIVVPGASHTAMMLCAANRLFPDGHFSLEDIHFTKALLMHETEQFQLQVIVGALQENRQSIQVVSQQLGGIGEWQCHATAVIKRMIDEVEPTSFPYCPTREDLIDADYFDHATFYQRMWEQGYHLGVTHAWVQEGWIRGHEVVTRLTLASADVKMNDYPLFPGLIDSCQQAIDRCQTIFRDPVKNNRIIYIPYGIDVFRLHRKLDHREVLWCVIKHDEANSSIDLINCNLYLYNSDRQLVAEILGYKSRLTKSDSFLMTGPKEQGVYQLDWQEKELLTGLDEIKKQALLASSAIEISKPFIRYQQAICELDPLSREWISICFAELNLSSHRHEPVSVLIERAGIIPTQQALFRHLLHFYQQCDMPQPKTRDHVLEQGLKLRATYPEAENEILLLQRAGSALAEVLTGKCDPLALLFPEDVGGQSAQVYAESIGARYLNQQIQSIVSQLRSYSSAEMPLRILELGAGTGGTSIHVLPLLTEGAIEYVYSDISSVFLENAKTKFKAYSFVSYQLLDIEKDLVQQGMDANSFDLIIAANVLHVSSDLAKTLDSINRLLSPRGKLVLLECTSSPIWLDLTFGLTPGWWRRQEHPLLTVAKWSDMMTTCGFGRSLAISQAADPSDAVIIAERGEHWLLMVDQQGIAMRLATELRAANTSVIQVESGDHFVELSPYHYQINLHRAEDYQHLLQKLQQNEIHLTGIAHLMSLDDEAGVNDISSAVERCGESALYLLQALIRVKTSPSPRIIFVTQKIKNPAAGVIDGISRVFNTEHSDISCCCIDIETSQDGALLFREFLQPDGEMMVAYRQGKRMVARLAHYESSLTGVVDYIKPDATYLITGGLGGLGLAIAQWLVDQGAKCLVLLSRSSGQGLSQQAIATWRKQGVSVNLYQTDVGERDQLEVVFAEIKRSMPPLKGVVHAAGVLHDAILIQQNWSSFAAVLKPKIQGAWYLHQLTQSLELDFFSLFSSVTGIMGTAGQANHAAANAFLDSFAHYRQSLGLCASSIDWGAWRKIGAAAARQIDEHHQELATGVGGIDPEVGIQIFASLVAENNAQVVVMPMNWQQFSTHNYVPMHRLLLQRFLIKTKQEKPEYASALKKEADDLLSMLKKLDQPAQKKLLESRILSLVAETLGMGESEELQAHYRFFDIGLDSLMALNLKSKMQTLLHCQLRSTLFFDYPSADRLSDYLLTEVLQPLQPEKIVVPIDDIAQRLKNKLRELHETA